MLVEHSNLWTMNDDSSFMCTVLFTHKVVPSCAVSSQLTMIKWAGLAHLDELISVIWLLYCANQLLFNLSFSTFSESLAHKPVTIHLIHEADIDYQCPICTEPLTEPYLTIECGHHLCRQCRDRLLSIGKTECPTCREPDALTNVVLDKNFQRKVKGLKVRCLYYRERCEWVGELRELHDHLDPAKGGYHVACPFGCGKYGRRSEMREHSRHHCHERMISCENCGYYNMFTIVTEKHYLICPRWLPQPALPNGRFETISAWTAPQCWLCPPTTPTLAALSGYLVERWSYTH